MGGMGVWSGLFLPPLSIGCDFWVGQAKARKELKGTLREATNKKNEKIWENLPKCGWVGSATKFYKSLFLWHFYPFFAENFR